MRDLTPEECEFIAGGLVRGAHRLDDEVAPVVVVASPPPYYPPPYYPPPAPPPYYPPPPPGGGGGGGGYTPSAAAAAFAANHMHLTGDLNDANTLAVYNAETTALEKLYDLGTNSPNTVIQEPDGKSMTAGQMLQQLSQVTVQIGPASAITDPTYGPAVAKDGADTRNPGNGGPVTIYIDPNNYNVSSNPNAFGQAAGVDYAVFHELGHAMTDSYNLGVQDPAQKEAIANTEGADLAAAVGMAYPTNAQLADRGGTVPN